MTWGASHLLLRTTPSSDYSNAPARSASRTINPDPGANDALSGLDTTGSTQRGSTNCNGRNTFTENHGGGQPSMRNSW